MRRIVFIAVFVTLAVLSAVIADRAKTNEIRDARREAIATYIHVTPRKYSYIYKDPNMDRSSRKVWLDAARDYCLERAPGPRPQFFGPNHPTRPMDCTGFGKE